MVPQRLEDSFFRALFESPIAGIAVGDIATRAITATNSKMLEIVGRDRDELEGAPDTWREITPPEYHHLDERAIEQFLERGYSDPFEKEYVRPDGSRVPVRVTATGVDGEPGKIVVFVQDLTAERAARAREGETQKRLEIALSAAEQGVWDYNLITGEMVYDDRAKQIYGLPIDQPVTFEIIRDATHPEDLAYTHAQLERAIDPKIRDRNSYEYRIVRPDGSVCWALAHGEAVFEGEGESEQAVRYAGTIQDITERKAAERHKEILIAELNHRVKNMLAIVQALAHQSFKNSQAESAAQTFSGRLSALAAAHNILTRSSWEAAEIRDIATGVLSHLEGADEQVHLSGDAAKVPPQLAVSIAMALHELATNAIKYGALSTPRGEVDLHWSVSRHSEPRLQIRWTEKGGPTVKTPASQGFGTRMLKRILASELSGWVRLDFDPAGLCCTIEAPVPIEQDMPVIPN
jgi:PAS domain S-box-containing protein